MATSEPIHKIVYIVAQLVFISLCVYISQYLFLCCSNLVLVRAKCHDTYVRGTYGGTLHCVLYHLV